LVLVTFISLAYSISIFQQNVGMQRTGWNNAEIILTPANVNANSFGLIGSVSTKPSPCSTQILYWENLNLGTAKNVLFCATNFNRDNDNITAYAIDADKLTVIWATYIGQGSFWSTHAPAIDDVTKTMYFIFKDYNNNGYTYLIGIDALTGKQLRDSPKLINATVAGTGEGSVNGQLAYQNTRMHQNTRTSILVVNSLIVWACGNKTDTAPYHGWVFGYKYDFGAQLFEQVGALCITPNASGGGIWQGSQGLASDGTYIYAAAGNGDFNPSKGDWGMCLLKLNQKLEVVDYFTPANWKSYSQADQDLGSCGSALIPNSNYMIVGITKYGSAHLVDTTNMGKWVDPTKDSCRQTISLNPHGMTWPGGNPVVWDNGQVRPIYFWPPNTPLTQMNFDPQTQLIGTPTTWANTVGGGLFITSNGKNNAILWSFGQSGQIHAFDASKDISAGPIYSVNQGYPVPFAWPAVVNGRLYVHNGVTSQILVYGLK